MESLVHQGLGVAAAQSCPSSQCNCVAGFACEGGAVTPDGGICSQGSDCLGRDALPVTVCVMPCTADVWCILSPGAYLSPHRD